LSGGLERSGAEDGANRGRDGGTAKAEQSRAKGSKEDFETLQRQRQRNKEHRTKKHNI